MKMREVAVVVLLAGSLANASEKPVARKDLPKAVEATLAKETSGLAVKSISSEPCEGKSKGQTCFEIETRRDTSTRDILIREDGAIVEDENGVAVKDLPEPVRSAATRLGGSILSAEHVTQDGSVFYELQIQMAGRVRERKFLPDGAAKK